MCGGAIAVTNLRGPTEVYPRVCGGAVLSGIIGVDSEGLSPRVRGTIINGQVFVS